MRVDNLRAAVLLLCATGVSFAQTSVVPTTTLAAQTANNTSAANSFASQTNGNIGAGNISKVNVHSLLYPGATTKVYAHLMLWFGKSDHMNVGYNSQDAAEIHRQITDMISRGIDGVMIDWYGPNSYEDQATKLVMAEAQTHPGFTFAIIVDHGAIEWESCSGCTPQQALISQLKYVEQTYFPSPSYMTVEGRPVLTNFDIDLYYTIDWNDVNTALTTPPIFLFQNSGGFTHALSQGSYAWIMPTTTDYGMSYLTSFYGVGIPLKADETVGATYKGFNDTLAAWGSNRIMGQQCGQTWLGTFSEINKLYSSVLQLSDLQLVTWNDYEEGTEIESGISNCVGVTASASSNTLQWTISGNRNTLDHFVPYLSTDGQNLMPLPSAAAGTSSVNLCSYSFPNRNYIAYVQAVGKPSVTNHMSGAVNVALNCGTTGESSTLALGASPSAITVHSGSSGQLNLTVTPKSGTINAPVALTCSGLPQNLSCSFAPASITPGGNPVTSVLTVSSVSVAARNDGDKTRFPIAALMFGFGLVGVSLIGNVERKRVWSVVIGCLLAVVMIGSTSCTGISQGPVNDSSSVSKNYVVTVNGNAGSIQASTTITVTLK